MSGGNWTGYVIGAIVGIVVGVLTAGIGLAAYAGTAGLFAFAVTSSLLTKPSGGSGIKNAVSDELQFASASESVVCPVIFGAQRIAGNYLCYEAKKLRAVGIYSEPEGGKGGGDDPEPVIVGYNYFLPFDYGLCMGPVDGILGVWDAATVSKLCGPGTFTDGEELLTLKGKESRGSVRVYQGTATQTRSPTDPYPDDFSNHRNVCYASFAKGFFIGTVPAPKTHAFELYRWPRCFGEDGLEVPGLKIRGSADEADQAWFDANPAAILYEILTNKVWGRGHSPALLDIPSFVAASEYYESRKLGLSFSLEDQDSIESIIDSIRGHVNCIIIWTGSKLKCRCMMDITSNGKVEAVFTADSMTNPEFNRPTSPDKVNELKLKFNNRVNGYKAEIAQVQDEAGINISGIVNSREVSLPGFSTRETAEAQASRILAEMAYPQASLSFTTNRFDMHIEPGMLIRVDWNEWAAGRTQTFWRIAEISDSNQDENGIQISCVEDLYSVPYEGAPVDYQALIPPWENDSFNTNEDLFGGEDQNEEQPLDPIAPGFAAEMNIWATRGKNIIFIGANDGGGGHTGFNHYWSPAGGSEFSPLGTTKGKIITGTILDALPGDGPLICRGDSFAFRVNLDSVESEATLLSSANKIAGPSDHMQALTEGVTDLLIVGREVIQIGRTVEIGTSAEYNVTNYLRGAMGSEIEAHPADSPFAFITNYEPNTFTIAQGIIDDGLEVDIAIYPKTAAGELNEPTTIEGVVYDSYGITPFNPSFLDGSKVGNNWSVKIRPRWHADGAWSKDKLPADLNNLVKDIPAGYSFAIQPFVETTPGVYDALDDVTFDDPTWVPDNGKNHNGGTVTLNLTISGADMVRVWTYWQGKPCETPVEYFGT